MGLIKKLNVTLKSFNEGYGEDLSDYFSEFKDDSGAFLDGQTLYFEIDSSIKEGMMNALKLNMFQFVTKGAKNFKEFKDSKATISKFDQNPPVPFKNVERNFKEQSSIMLDFIYGMTGNLSKIMTAVADVDIDTYQKLETLLIKSKANEILFSEKLCSKFELELHKIISPLFVLGNSDLDEGMHYSTKMRQLEASDGARQAKMAIREAKRMVENFLDINHPSPNPASDIDAKKLYDTKTYLDKSLASVSEAKLVKRKRG